jgi:hypothetical protein
MNQPLPDLSSRIPKTAKACLKPSSRLLSVVMLALFCLPTLAGDRTLKAGTWKGTFLTHDGTLYKIKYIVRYDEESDDTPLKIKMINLDLEPASEFTYQLSDIDIDIEEKQLQFKIPKEFETKMCTLKQKDNAWSGTCLSNAGDAEETGEITMMLPESGTETVEAE